MNTSVDIHERIKYLREKVLNLKQSEMSLMLGLKQGSLSDIERKKTKTVTDRIIKDISREFNINENWLRTGEGEMFIEMETFSLDELAKKSNLTELEIRIVRSYMNLDRDIREKLMNELEAIFKPTNNETVATTEEDIKTKDNIEKQEEAATLNDPVEVEIARYRMELEAEKKAEKLLASRKQEPS